MENDLISARAKLKHQESKCTSLLEALKEQERLGSDLARDSARKHKEIEQKYVHLLGEYKDRIKDMESLRQENEDEVRTTVAVVESVL